MVWYVSDALQEFSGDNTALYEEEKQIALEQSKAVDQQRQMAVPGLMGPAATADDAMM